MFISNAFICLSLASFLISSGGFAQSAGMRASPPVTEEQKKEIAQYCPNLTVDACKKRTDCILMKTCNGREFCRSKPQKTSHECGAHSYDEQELPCCPGTKTVCVHESYMAPGESMPYCLACGNGYCEMIETEQNCPEDCKKTGTKGVNYRLLPDSKPAKSVHKIEPTILSNPVNQGDIPQFVEHLNRAYQEKNASICLNLPEPQKQTFHHDDYSTTSPNRASWVTYCEALATHDQNKCYSINSAGSTLNLKEDCLYFFQFQAEKKNDSPQFCLDELGKTYRTAGAVKNCLGSWKIEFYGHREWDEIQRNSSQLSFPKKLIDLDICLKNDHKERDSCIYDLAVRTKDEKICMLISDPYGGIYDSTSPPGRKDRRNCLKTTKIILP